MSVQKEVTIAMELQPVQKCTTVNSVISQRMLYEKFSTFLGVFPLIKNLFSLKQEMFSVC